MIKKAEKSIGFYQKLFSAFLLLGVYHRLNLLSLLFEERNVGIKYKEGISLALVFHFLEGIVVAEMISYMYFNGNKIGRAHV